MARTAHLGRDGSLGQAARAASSGQSDGIATVPLAPAASFPEFPSIDPLPGQVVNEGYLVSRAIGAGGAGVVYRAYDASHRRFALKILNASSSRQDWQSTLAYEAYVLSRIKHPHVVRYVDDGILKDGRVFLVMEYLKGQTLAELTDLRGTLPAELALRMILDAARGLQATHALDMVHRDIKPSNLFVSEEDSSVRLIDFGVAVHRACPPRTARIGLVGTPRYMAPEQVEFPEEVDARSDIFSLGLTLYETISGSFPYPWEATNAMLSRRVNGSPVPLERFVPRSHLPSSLFELLDLQLRPDPRLRVQSMREVTARLEEVAEDLARGGHWPEIRPEWLESCAA